MNWRRPPHGYAGSALRVNLRTREATVTPTALHADRLLGGTGVAAQLLWDRASPSVDPLGPENPLVFSTGPLTGTVVPGSGHCSVACKSPFGAGLCSSRLEGFLGPELKYAGYDHLIVEGTASEPSLLYVCDREIRVLPAAHLWGLAPNLTTKAVRNALNEPEMRVVCIGPAGERLLYSAGLFSGVFEAKGAAGVGAVMGSKNLKAIGVKGTGGIRVANPEALRRQCSCLRKSLNEASDVRTSFPFQDAGRASCFNCPLACTMQIESSRDGEVLLRSSDCVVALQMGISIEEVPKVIATSKKYGYNSEKLCFIISHINNLLADGLISEVDFGFPLIRGNVAGIEQLLRHFLAKPRAVASLATNGRGLAGGALHPSEEVRGLPCGFRERIAQQARCNAADVGNTAVGRPAAAIAASIVALEDADMLASQLGICRRSLALDPAVSVAIQAALLSSVLGDEVAPQRLVALGRRAVALTRAYDGREAIQRREPAPGIQDSGTLSREEGESQCDVASIGSHYHRLRDEDDRGVPRAAALDALGLNEIKDELARVGAYG